MHVFHREALATEMAARILSAAGPAAAASGLLLVAPRRTGKSTFLRADLVPELRRSGALVIHVDLWEDRSAEPGMVIVEAIRQELWKHAHVMRRLVQAVALDADEADDVSFVLDRVGLGSGISLAAAFELLAADAQQPIVLILDEAQHASTSALGNDALFALKGARDRLNAGPYHGMRILASGSHRDKLAMLCHSHDQPFFCAPWMELPPLGMDFVQWFCTRQTYARPLDAGAVFHAFRRAGYRPQMLQAAALAVPRDTAGDALDLRFASAIDTQITEHRRGQLRVVEALTPLDSTVLRVAAARGHRFSPFWPDTMRAYREVMARLAPDDDTPIDHCHIDLALESLCDKSLLWRNTHGVYALQETGLDALLRDAGMLGVVPALS